MASNALAQGTLLLPETALAPHQLGLIINRADPLSRAIGDYYRHRRGIPEANVIFVDLPNTGPNLEVSRFKTLYREVSAVTPPQVQIYALAWARPYRVGCQSITTALATGYDPRYCGEKLPDLPCALTGKSPYFASNSRGPYIDHRIRPSMLLAAETFDDAKRLIERGIAADGTFPKGTAYLLSTSDKSRTVRDQGFGRIRQILGSQLDVSILKQDDLQDRHDVLFYFTGKARVDRLDTLTFVPGAVADHLTSSGGRMAGKGVGEQMSAMRWLEAGATGSYGTVIEPCNIPDKFPNPGLLMQVYLGGASLIEAYWKSVARPGEGLFIGEPLTAPFAPKMIRFDGDSVTLPAGRIAAGRYQVQIADFPVGPYRDSGRRLEVSDTGRPTRLDGLQQNHLRLARR